MIRNGRCRHLAIEGDNLIPGLGLELMELLQNIVQGFVKLLLFVQQGLPFIRGEQIKLFGRNHRSFLHGYDHWPGGSVN
jgi:hypothetical protein